MQYLRGICSRFVLMANTDKNIGRPEDQNETYKASLQYAQNLFEKSNFQLELKFNPKFYSRPFLIGK